MTVDSNHLPASHQDPSDVIIIHDPEIDVEALMEQIRAGVAERRAAGAYAEDLDRITEEVRAEVLGAFAASPGAAGLDGMPLLGELESRWLIREPAFTSNAPVVGPLIVLVRRAWNWMSTKWYVRGILDQQVGYNALVLQALSELHVANRSLAAEVTELRARAAELEAEVISLRTQHPDATARSSQGSADS